MSKPSTEQQMRALDSVMLGRFVAQYEEGAQGFFVDADEAQEVALQVKAALSLGSAIMDEVHADTAIPTDVCQRIYAAIKRASANAVRNLTPDVVEALNLAREIEALRNGVDAFNPDAGMAASSAFDAAEQLWKLAPRIIAALSNHKDSGNG